jgi:microsomal dipeptidase-like Zn-dependent dipeptidase
VITDWHSHYPMHLMTLTHDEVLDHMTRVRGRRPHRHKLQAIVLWIASHLGNYRSFFSGPRVTLDLLRAGDVGVALSVVYAPFDEMDLGKGYPSPPDRGYLVDVEDQITIVEAHIAAEGAGKAVVVRNAEQLDGACGAGLTALVHCVEGGFHLGDTDEEVSDAVRKLARRGVAYITLAHLFWREVAVNANALPFLPDPVYNFLWPQPRDEPLAQRARAAVAAMVEHRVLIDLSHMREDAVHATLDLLDELDPQADMPVVSTHTGFRFGKQNYMCTQRIVERIAARDGLIGLIFAQHQLNDGIRKRLRTLDDSFAVICDHIDRIHEITGSYDHVAFGTDLDGFIKPTLSGLEDAATLAQLPPLLAQKYGAAAADQITHGNTLRVLRRLWRQAPPS